MSRADQRLRMQCLKLAAMLVANTKAPGTNALTIAAYFYAFAKGQYDGQESRGQQTTEPHRTKALPYQQAQAARVAARSARVQHEGAGVLAGRAG